MNFTLPQKIIIGVVAAVILFFVAGYLGLIPGFLKDQTPNPPQIDLEVWGIESRDVFNNSVNAYRNFRTNVDVNYKQINPAEYESELINAFAAGKGPDVFEIHNTWLPKHYDKMSPVTDAQFTLASLREKFPTVVEQDFAPNKVIFALPLYIDTLAFYYNYDIFDSAGIAKPPVTWEEFQNLIPKLRRLDKSGNFTRYPAAIGGSFTSMDTASDLLSLFMLQNGTTMTDYNFTRAAFADRYYISEENQFPGFNALNFYTKFANKKGIYYSWDGKANALESFSQGKTVMMFDYYGRKKVVESMNPYLKFRVGPMMQLKKDDIDVNYPSYLGLGVSKESKIPEWAWDFSIYITTDEGSSNQYLEAANHPPALRSLINNYLADPELGFLAKQALSARSWPQIDNNFINQVFSDMIDNVNQGKLDTATAIEQAASQVTDLMEKRAQ
ncbi:MAG: extracellular solute-binding protein [Candidatus Pacebacteria bacterium]|nr:extracellular solute-binding protein [Candidatus Paceibacterota bacterium]